MSLRGALHRSILSYSPLSDDGLEEKAILVLFSRFYDFSNLGVHVYGRYLVY